MPQETEKICCYLASLLTHKQNMDDIKGDILYLLWEKPPMVHRAVPGMNSGTSEEIALQLIHPAVALYKANVGSGGGWRDEQRRHRPWWRCDKGYLITQTGWLWLFKLNNENRLEGKYYGFQSGDIYQLLATWDQSIVNLSTKEEILPNWNLLSGNLPETFA